MVNILSLDLSQSKFAYDIFQFQMPARDMCAYGRVY